MTKSPKKTVRSVKVWGFFYGDDLVVVQKHQMLQHAVYFGMDGLMYGYKTLNKAPITITYTLPPNKGKKGGKK